MCIPALVYQYRVFCECAGIKNFLCSQCSVAIEALWQCDAPRLRPQAARVFDCAAAANVFGLAATKTCRANTLEVTCELYSSAHTPKTLIDFVSDDHVSQ